MKAEVWGPLELCGMAVADGISFVSKDFVLLDLVMATVAGAVVVRMEGNGVSVSVLSAER
jgi:hypothetical protein